MRPGRRAGGGRKGPAELRFETFFVRDLSGCWLWRGCLNSRGYGCFSFGGKGKTVLAHRWIYEHLFGPVPAGLALDHLCRVRSCVNPAHLEAVTPQENTARGRSFAGREALAMRAAGVSP